MLRKIRYFFLSFCLFLTLSDCRSQPLGKGVNIEGETFYASFQNLYEVDNKKNRIYSPTFYIGYDINPQTSTSLGFNYNEVLTTFWGEALYKPLNFLSVSGSLTFRNNKFGIGGGMQGVFNANKNTYAYLGVSVDVSSQKRTAKDDDTPLMFIPLGLQTKLIDTWSLNLETALSPFSIHTYFSVGITYRYNRHSKKFINQM